jgi:hypothetical protein
MYIWRLIHGGPNLGRVKTMSFVAPLLGIFQRLAAGELECCIFSAKSLIYRADKDVVVFSLD